MKGDLENINGVWSFKKKYLWVYMQCDAGGTVGSICNGSEVDWKDRIIWILEGLEPLPGVQYRTSKLVLVKPYIKSVCI